MGKPFWFQVCSFIENVMLEEFLSHKHTTASCDRDFKEWHLGIPYYGFWAILVDNPKLLSVVSKAQTQLQPFFLPSYRRQAHITLNACGLLSETHFSQSKLDQQINNLKILNLSPFELSLGHIDSFSTSAYLSVFDTSKILHKINKALNQIVSDSTPAKYTPHITLGLYRDKFECKHVSEEILKFKTFDELRFKVTKIQFCRYQTANIQGPIEVIKEIKF
jgi:2'-5' RNA ligase